MAENLDSKIKKQALSKGLLLGIILFLLGIFSFYFITKMTDSFALMIIVPFVISVVIPIVISIIFILNMRKQIGGYWLFKQAVSAAFIMFFVGYIVSGIGKDVFFAKFIEPDMAQKTSQAIINSTTRMLEKSGVDQTKIDEKIAEAQKGFDEQNHLTFGKIIQSILITIIFIFIISLIFGALFKKDPLREVMVDNAVGPNE